MAMQPPARVRVQPKPPAPTMAPREPAKPGPKRRSWLQAILIGAGLGIVLSAGAAFGHQAIGSEEVNTGGLVAAMAELFVWGLLAGVGLRWNAYFVPAVLAIVVVYRVVRFFGDPAELGTTATLASLVGLAAGAVAQVVYRVVGGKS